ACSFIIMNEHAPSVALVLATPKIFTKATEGACSFIIMNDTFNNHSVIATPGKTRNKAKHDPNQQRRKPLKGIPQKTPLNIPFHLAEQLWYEGWQQRDWVIWDKTDQGIGDCTQTDKGRDGFEFILYHFKHPSNTRPFSRMKPGFLKSNILRCPPMKGKAKKDTGHRCPFPPELVEPLILACTEPGETVVDLFGGSGSTAVAALRNGRKCVTGDLSEANCAMTVKRCLPLLNIHDEDVKINFTNKEVA
ncbi:MAG: DNA methyltransferase, partial [Bacteroidota bacterium]